MKGRQNNDKKRSYSNQHQQLLHNLAFHCLASPLHQLHLLASDKQQQLWDAGDQTVANGGNEALCLKPVGPPPPSNLPTLFPPKQQNRLTLGSTHSTLNQSPTLPPL